MRVALLAPRFWPEVRRGSERFVAELADGLRARGHDATILTSHASPRRTESGGVVRVPRLPEGRLERRMFERHLTHVPFALRELRRLDPDVAHATYPTDGLAAARWRRETGRPAVLSYMGIPHRQALANRRLRVEVTQRAVAGASAVVALSDAARAGFARWLGVDARVIAPGVDLAAFTPDPAARATVPTILCAADLNEPRKRVALLAEAFALVRRDLPDARLVLSRPRGQAPGWTRAPGIELADLDDRAALADANRDAWAAALPSWGEAFGLVALEAMACGTPVLVSDREALPEVVDRPAVGRRFAGDDPAVVAAALRETLALAGDPATAIACRARAEQFSTDRTTDAYVALYEELRGT